MVLKKLLVSVTCALVWVLAGCSPPPPAGAESVIVVHGLGRTSASMTILVSRLKNAGFRVISFGYPSTSEPMEALVDRLQAEVGRCCEAGAGTVHFVTHSMGGVLVRSYLDRQPEAHEGRVVMLSPPNQGSEIIDAFADSPLLQRIVGPAGSSLGTDSAGISSQLGPVRFGLGIVTGDRSMNPLGSWLIPGPDDGKVSVDRARVEGATDFMVVPATHTFIMNRRDVAEEVVHFLRQGRFRPED
jgi:pimeloyl-ACP methyl ester carboxylesterase